MKESDNKPKTPLENIQIIGFDADDTLWINETLFRQAEKAFFQILESYDVPHVLAKELYKTELQNLNRYGYGIKSFTLCLVETAIRVSGGGISAFEIQSILDLTKELMAAPVELLPDVSKTLKSLSKKFKLILLTKGDLVDQERKLEVSKLEELFHHIEIMSEKNPSNYQKVLDHLDIDPDRFLMVGNSLRSDILPVLEIGSKAIHIPFHTTWVHEEVSKSALEDKDFIACEKISELTDLLKPSLPK